ncbi:MAG: sulfite exporter TauE/SafE family protein, partial [Aliarcobacter sp.]|nr:sulfite exporter TauE/SafE family protein [Aliarcobacter sp.]
ITHILKVFVFTYFGFVFFDYIEIIFAMIIGLIAGCWLGTKLRDKIDAKKFTIVLKVLLTALAIIVIASVFI